MRKITVTMADYDRAVRILNSSSENVCQRCAVAVAARRTWKKETTANRCAISFYQKNKNRIIKDRITFLPISDDSLRLAQFVDAFDARSYDNGEISKAMLPLTITLSRG